MSKKFLALAIVALVASPAFAQQRLNKGFSLTAQPISNQFDDRGVPAGTTALYDSDEPGLGNVAPAASPNLRFDDYDTTTVGDTAFITGFQFVGGVPAASDSMRFTWGVYLPPSTTFGSPSLVPLISTSAPLGLYGVGNFGWTFTFTGVVSIPDTGLLGGLAYFAIDGPTATDDVVWFHTGSLGNPVVTGSNVANIGSAAASPSQYQRFSFFVPDPATLSLLAVGGLLAARRRK